jgi:hypothetical protein
VAISARGELVINNPKGRLHAWWPRRRLSGRERIGQYLTEEFGQLRDATLLEAFNLYSERELRPQLRAVHRGNGPAGAT